MTSGNAGMPQPTAVFDVEAIRAQFPILKRMVKGKPLVYLDNAATTQKPQAVIDSLVHYYSNYNANIHRGLHTLADEATADFERTRDAMKRFINAPSREEVIFTSGTSEGINLVAATWGRANLQEGDELIVSGMEHHSNIVPWQIVCNEKKAVIKVIPVNEAGELDMEAFHQLLSPKTKMVSIVHVSNALGTINPVKEIIRAAHAAGALVLVDGAQSTVHLEIDVQDLDCDFFAMSAHKIYGPTGVGVLYGKRALLEAMPVYQGGGEMIKEVTFEKTTYNELPYKFEAGTPNIADVIAFRAALEFVEQTGKQLIAAHEHELMTYATGKLQEIDGLSIIGTSPHKASVISFVLKGIHPQDIGILLDNQGLALRIGNHCAQPLMDHYCIPGTIRASFAMYNKKEEVDVLVSSINRAIRMLL